MDAAAEFMRTNTLESDAQITSQLTPVRQRPPRAVPGLPRRAPRHRGIRARLERSLGRDFDVRDFHEAILSEGAMPLRLLDQHVDRSLSRRPDSESTRGGRPERSSGRARPLVDIGALPGA